MYSRTLEVYLKHLQLEHLQLVIERIQEVGLKLKPSKCFFVQKEVEYLGLILTPDGVRTSPRLVAAVKEFPTPRTSRK